MLSEVGDLNIRALPGRGERGDSKVKRLLMESIAGPKTCGGFYMRRMGRRFLRKAAVGDENFMNRTSF